MKRAIAVTILSLCSSVALAAGPAPIKGANGHVFGTPLPAGAKFSTHIPSDLKTIVLDNTSLHGNLKLNGVTEGDGHWNIAVNQGHGAGSKTQTFVVTTSGQIVDKTPVQVEPAHTGTNSDL